MSFTRTNSGAIVPYRSRPAALLKNYMEHDDLESLAAFDQYRKELTAYHARQWQGDSLEVECFITLSSVAHEAGYGDLIDQFWIRGVCVCRQPLFINARNARAYHRFPFCNWYSWIPRLPSVEKAAVVQMMIERPNETVETLKKLYQETIKLRTLKPRRYDAE